MTSVTSLTTLNLETNLYCAKSIVPFLEVSMGTTNIYLIIYFKHNVGPTIMQLKEESDKTDQNT